MTTMAVALDRNSCLAYCSSWILLGTVWFPNLTRAYDNNGRRPRQKFVFGILQLLVSSLLGTKMQIAYISTNASNTKVSKRKFVPHSLATFHVVLFYFPRNSLSIVICTY